MTHHVPHLPEAVRRDDIEDWSRTYVEEGWPQMWLAKRDGVSIALLHRQGSKIEALNADPEHMREGAGSALMGQAEADAKAEGHAYLEMDTYASNELARRFYAKRGYVVTKEWRQKAYTRIPIPMVTMRMEL